MSSTYGDNLHLSIFGQSHGPGIGMTLDGIPAGLKVDEKALLTFLKRRAPGQGPYATPRKEADAPEFLSGIVDGHTCGAPIAALIRNTNTRSGDYGILRDQPRPGHADYTAEIKYGGCQDPAGGGHFSGRLTAPLCVAGGLCKQWLAEKGIWIAAHISSIGGIFDKEFDQMDPDFSEISEAFPVISPDAGAQMLEAIALAKAQGDSLGGVIQCAVKGLPAGLGDPMFDGMENRIAKIVFGIPAVKGLEFGSGFAGSACLGSENNDGYTVKNGAVTTLSNHAGGILGGITNGLPLLFRVAVKPTPSISRPQPSVSLSRMEDTFLSVPGRHDPCIVPRAVPVVEAAAALAVFDAYLSRMKEKWR